MSEPKCPECEVVGVEHIVSVDSKEQNGVGDAWFNIAHCEKCGHVYGVFAKVVNKASNSIPIPDYKSLSEL